jgi:hypothetical protein
MADLLLFQLLWEPLPDRLPTGRPQRRQLPRLRDLAAAVTASTASMSVQEQVSRNVRRGAVQALVLEAYQVTIAEQDREHRAPDTFTQAWHDHLADLGWGVQQVCCLGGCSPARPGRPAADWR